MRLTGKTAIVTGGARGIGFAIARRFLREDARVVIADIDEAGSEKAVEDLKDLGEVVFAHCDVGQRLDVHNLVAFSLDAFGEIDILVNNAGILVGGDVLTLSEKDFDAVMRVNLKGAFLCSQAVARVMVKRVEDGHAPGAIVNMSSTNALLALPDQVPYCVSKGAVRQLTNAFAQALAPHGIRVNAVGPGSVATEMLSAVNADVDTRRRVLARTPLGRIAEPDEIAAIAAFLASPDASYITGQTVYADGGRLGQAYAQDLPEGVDADD